MKRGTLTANEIMEEKELQPGKYTLTAPSVLGTAQCPAEGCLPTQRAVPATQGLPRTLQVVPGLASGPLWMPQTMQLWSWPCTDQLSEEQDLFSELRNSIRGLCWHEDLLPLLKMLFPRACAVIGPFCAHTHRGFVGFQSPRRQLRHTHCSPVCTPLQTSEPNVTIPVQH